MTPRGFTLVIVAIALLGCAPEPCDEHCVADGESGDERSTDSESSTGSGDESSTSSGESSSGSGEETSTDSGDDSTTDSGDDDSTTDSGDDDSTTDSGDDDSTTDSGDEDSTTDSGGDDSTTDSGGDDSTTDSGGDDSTTDSGDDSTTDSGDDGQEGLPDAPTLQLEYSQVKRFEFNWDPVNADFYQLFESADSGQDFVQIGGDIIGGSIAFTMPLHFRVNASYVLRACNDLGCTDSAIVPVIGEMVEAVGYFKASNTDELDDFGMFLALSDDGRTLAVTSRAEQSSATGIDGNQFDNSADKAGAVYVFVEEDGVWSQQAYIKASNTGPNNFFGVSVALSADGNTLAVGASHENSFSLGIDGDQYNFGPCNVGAVYVYVREGEDWSQQAYVKQSNTPAWEAELFGVSVALSDDGNTLAVGAMYEDSAATGIDGTQLDDGPGSGAVFVFVRDGTQWSQQAYVKASNTEQGDRFGISIALSSSGDTLAVAAESEDSNATGIDGNQADNSASKAGAVYVYVRNGTQWSQQAYIKASNTDAGDYFGFTNALALSADGNTLAVGADEEDSAATGIDGDQADNSAKDAGAVYVFVRDGTQWSQQAYVKASNPEQSDSFGATLTLSADGDTLAVGATAEKSSSKGFDGNQADNTYPRAGAVYLFVRKDGVWSQHAYLKSPNTDAGQSFGYALSLSADAQTLAIGTWGEGSVATGIGGDQNDDSLFHAGAAYLY